MIGFYSAGAMGQGGGGGDPYWTSVASLLHFDGADASTAFTDQKGKVWTPTGNAQIDTAQFKFGGASGLFDGSGDSITAAAHVDFGFGGGDWTVEGWFRPADATGDECVYDNRGGGSTGCAIYSSISSGGGTNRWGFANNTAVAALGSNLTAAVWVFLAVSKQGTAVRGYKNGVQDWAYTDSRTYSATAPASIGAGNGVTQPYNGHIDEFRITKGVCRYPDGTTFTPPTAPFPNS